MARFDVNIGGLARVYPDERTVEKIREVIDLGGDLYGAVIRPIEEGLEQYFLNYFGLGPGGSSKYGFGEVNVTIDWDD